MNGRPGGAAGGIALLFAGALAACAPGLRGQEAEAGGDGVFPDSIVFGQSAVLSGENRELGVNMNLGVRAAFDEANRAGGIHGRALRLVLEDDRYEAELAVEKTRTLIAHGVFGLIGAVGTPTSRVAWRIASDAQVPYIGAFTGAGLLRGADQRYVVNLRASYGQETEEMVERLTHDLGFRRIAIFYQDDSYGLAGLTGVLAALAKRDLALVGQGTYVRNTAAVKRALLDIRESNPEAIITIGAYRAAAQFILWARKLGMRAVHLNVSFVGSNSLLKELGGAGDGVVVTQVVPFPRDRSIPVVADYQAAIRQIDGSAQPGFVSLEGYLAGRLVVEALRASTEPGGPPPAREAFLQWLVDAGPYDLGGFHVEFGAGDNQGSERVFLTEIRGGRFVPVTRLRR